jgi:hydroxyacyl-ACP dehydratase HTD2-like protein with hotdog domain
MKLKKIFSSETTEPISTLKKFLFLAMAAILDKDGSDGHNFERGPPKDH